MSGQDNNQRYNDIGTRIQESVLDALRTGDFNRLNVDITDSVKEVLNGVGDTINTAARDVKGTASAAARGFTSSAGARTYRDIAQEDIARHTAQRDSLKKSPNVRVRFEDKGLISGLFQIILGFPFALTGLATTITGIFHVPEALVAGLVLLIGGMLVTIKGAKKLKLRNIAKRYRDYCKGKGYVSIEDIVNSTGEDKEKVIKNVKKILNKGFFPEGYIDEQNTTLMVSKKVYEQYLATENNRKELEREELEKKRAGKMTDAEQTELNVMISKGRDYMNRLHQLNDNIPGEVITGKLNRLENILGEIFNRVGEHPEQMVNCRKLMDYYLPTMIKLVEAYEEYDKVSHPGEDITKAKAEIEKTLDIINQAFVELLNKLYQSSVWDVTAEAKVLKTMLQQEGLAEDDLTLGSYKIGHEEDTEQEEEFVYQQQEEVEVPVLHDV